ncbi:hypothetical protein VTN77DRAFT_4208 [Rasamsonia byssochlamydoides]|uniref:uncharacterized protein n=1 Tax=Rasamsonia byssochlamydoides TaxID=89139 RepID=UPI00374295C3
MITKPPPVTPQLTLQRVIRASPGVGDRDGRTQWKPKDPAEERPAAWKEDHGKGRDSQKLIESPGSAAHGALNRIGRSLPWRPTGSPPKWLCSAEGAAGLAAIRSYNGSLKSLALQGLLYLTFGYIYYKAFSLLFHDAASSIQITEASIFIISTSLLAVNSLARKIGGRY